MLKGLLLLKLLKGLKSYNNSNLSQPFQQF
jgi:hypothetical protein